MQLLKRTTLVFQEGRSDKIYEVDLCQVSSELYVVNFRYGKRGSTLKEGTKTDQAVPLAEAEQVFAKLVKSKTTKGYQDVAAVIADSPPAQRSPQVLPVPTTDNPQHQAILSRLANPESKSKWPLERAVWRAGELKLREATPLLMALLGNGQGLRDYCLVWALGWCGDTEAWAVCDRLYHSPATSEAVRRIAFEALLKLSDTAQQSQLRSDAIAQLPVELRSVAQTGSASQFLETLTIYLEGGKPQTVAVLEHLYQVNNEIVRPALLEVLKSVPLRPNYFKQWRHLFKQAEYRRDGEVFGILAYRLEKEAALYNTNPYYVRLPDNSYLRRYDYRYDPTTRSYERIPLDEFVTEMRRPDARIAYSSATRDYLRRRVWRSLRKLGEQADTNYPQMAAGVLLPYTDADAEPVRQSVFYSWDRETWQRLPTTTIDWDIFARYLPFNHILYENSPRYELTPNSRAWRCQSPYKPGDPDPSDREEAFPQLWEQQPEQLLRLLLEGHCRPVHHFAVKALRTCASFCRQLSINQIIGLLNATYEITAQLGLELACDRYQPQDPDLALVSAMVCCILPEARTTAYQWIEQKKSLFLADSLFVADLITSPQADTRQFARRLLSSPIANTAIAQAIIGRAIATLLSWDSSQAERAREAGETLLLNFASQLRSLGLGMVLDLLHHPALEVQELGARILLNHETPASDLPPGLIDSLINSQFESIRRLGVELFGQLPDERLLQSDRLLLTMLLHKLPDIREAIRPVIQRLGAAHPAFDLQIASVLIDALLLPETHEGVHRHLIEVLQGDLTGWMSQADQAMAERLLQAESAIAQELAGVILQANVSSWAGTYSTLDIVTWGNHEVLTVRTAAREMLLQILPRLRQDPLELAIGVKFLESGWEDMREFGFRLFGTFLTAAEFTPTILVSLCDSNRPDVRKFGRDLVSRCFREADGQEYLLKFSEHPATDMQLFATNYLEGYAIDRPDRLQELTPYFIRALSQVNKGRVAKQRIFAFLTREIEKSESAAQIVADIMARQSATIAIGDKAKTIQILLKIHQMYPQIPVPIQVKPVPTK